MATLPGRSRTPQSQTGDRANSSKKSGAEASPGLTKSPVDEPFLPEIFQNASVGMALEDTAGHMLFVNDTLCQMFGYSNAEIMKLRCADFSHPVDYEREAVLFNELLAGERQSYEIEKRFLHRDGPIVWGKVHVTLLKENPNGSRVVLGIVEDITVQKDALEKLTLSRKEVESLASRLILSQEDERRRIARELHDDIGQRLSMVASEVHVFEGHLHNNGQSGRELVERLGTELDALVTDIHGLSHRLHSSQLQHLGVVSALHDLCRQLGRSGLEVEIDLDKELGPVPENIALCLYRVAQEALTNALKHSGASRAALTLGKTAHEYTLVVRDAGEGFDMVAAAQGLGLISMRERLRTLQGTFSLTSSPGRGTQIAVTLPRVA